MHKVVHRLKLEFKELEKTFTEAMKKPNFLYGTLTWDGTVGKIKFINRIHEIYNTFILKDQINEETHFAV
jgi:hypothetical protein